MVELLVNTYPNILLLYLLDVIATWHLPTSRLYVVICIWFIYFEF